MSDSASHNPPLDEPETKERDWLQAHRFVKEVPLREVRFAVTMVGGTSLAIYENGVAQELYRVVQGFGLYGLLKRLTQSHAYIDILSGTSAGGINTILLSAALTMGRDFRQTRETWIDLGGIDALQQDPKNARVEALFRGDTYYIGEIERAFNDLSTKELDTVWKERCIPSGLRSIGGQLHYTDLDLLVTGTYYRGQAKAFVDSRNRPIFTHNHAGVFHLKHRARRDESHFHQDLYEPRRETVGAENPRQHPNARDQSHIPRRWFASGRNQGEGANPWENHTRPPTVGEDDSAVVSQAGKRDASLATEHRELICKRLARVARTTSSLPAIFEPSSVDRLLMNGIIDLPNEPSVSYMMDGGYLNNRPLNLVMPEIARRPATGEVLRKVIFVEPQPEELRQLLDEHTKAPTALRNLAFFAEVPNQQGLSSSLSFAEEHNRRVRRVRETLQAARRLLCASGPDPNGERRSLWRETCLLELRTQLLARWREKLGLQGFGEVVPIEEGRREPAAATSDLIRDYEKRREQLDRLRALSNALWALMQEQCVDPGPHSAPGTFTLCEVDVNSLIRKIQRATDEIYRALYPRAEVVPADTAMQTRRQEIFRNLEDTGGLAIVQLKLQQLDYLFELAEILNENLAMVAATVAVSKQYGKAADTEFKREQKSATEVTGKYSTELEGLWELLVGSIRELMKSTRRDEKDTPEPEPSDGRGWAAALHVPPDTTPEAFSKLIRAQREGFARLLTQRSQEICAVLDQQKDKAERAEASNPQHDRLRSTYRDAGASAPQQKSLVTELDGHVNRIVHEAAAALGEVLRAEEKKSLAQDRAKKARIQGADERGAPQEAVETRGQTDRALEESHEPKR